MKQCPNCGSSNNDSDVSCSYCGYQFDSTANGSNCPAENNNSNDSAANDNNYSAENNNSNFTNDMGSYTAYDNNNNYDNNDYSSTGNNYSEPYCQNTAPFQSKTNSYAIASLVLGIVSIPLMCCCVGVITAILAVIFGFLARNRIAASNGYETGSGMALAGIILGFAAIGIAIIMLIVNFASLSSGNFWDQFNKNFEEQFRKQLEQQQQNRVQ